MRAIDSDLADLTVEFDGRPVLYAAHELDQPVLAYATTVHKAQGCEYLAVVIPVTTQHYPMLQWNLIYTGITRGRKLVVLVGQKRALRWPCAAPASSAAAPGSANRCRHRRERPV